MLEVALRSTAILAGAWLMIRLMPRATAATRHLVWHIALAGTVLTAMLGSVPNVPRVPIVPSVPMVPEVPAVLGTLAVLSEQAAQVANAVDVLSNPANPVTPNIPGTLGTLGTLGPLGTLGTLATTLWFALGWVAAARLARRAAPAPVEWQLELTALCQRLHIYREVRLGIIESHSSPLATGLVRSSILLPRTAIGWSDDRRHAVLLHELAHIQRHDCRAQLVAHAACALYWFNPFVWMAASALRREREHACDDQVLQLGARASSYAAHLLDVACELRSSMRPSAALAMARPSDLEGRLLSVLAADRARAPQRATRWLVMGVLSVTSLAAASLTAAPPSAKGADAPSAAATRYLVASDVMSSSPDASGRAEAETTLREAPDADERERAALALAFSSGRDVVPALLKALADPAAQVREKAAIGLALRRDPRVVEPLIAALADTDSQVREKAAIALGTSGDPRALDALTRALDDPDAQVREKAAAGLTLFGLTR